MRQPIPTGPTGLWGWSLLLLCYLGIAATAVKAVSACFMAFQESLVAGRVGCALRRRAARCLLERGLHDSEPRVLATIAVRIREIEGATVSGVLVVLRAAAQLVPLLAALIFVSLPLALGGIAVLVPFGLGISLLRHRWRAASGRAQRLVESLHSGVDDLVRNLDLWRSYGAGAQVEREIAASGERATIASARVDAARAALSGTNEVLAALALLGVVVLAKRLGWPLGDGKLVAFAAIFFMAYRPLRDLGDARAWIARGSVALDGLNALLQDASAPSEPLTRTERATPEPPARLDLERVGSARRGPRTSVRVEPGELVAVVGATGSGKTTLLRALLGLEPADGSVRYAGRDLTHAPVGPASRPFAWVPQDAPLVTGTVLDNVALLAGDERGARDALEQIGATGLLELGGEIVGPGGRALSGGERRQVAIARALATGLPVLLIDEPTAGLDADAAERVLGAVRHLRGARSALVVTHRPEVTALADRVIAIGTESAGAGV